MKFKSNYFENYIASAPLPLAIERTIECQILSKRIFMRPVLDIGCGDGIFAHNLFSEPVDVGIDPNKRELESAKKFKCYNELIQCYGSSIPKPSGYFNTIFSNSVMEHIDKIEDVLKESKRLMSNDGVLFLTLPTNMFERYTIVYQVLSKLRLEFLAKRYTRFFNRFWAHYHCYDIEGWKSIFEKCGFKVVNVQEYASKKVCLVNAMLTPFSLPSFILKKISNKWVFSRTRKLIAPFLSMVYKKMTTLDEPLPGQGGLVLFELRK